MDRVRVAFPRTRRILALVLALGGVIAINVPAGATRPSFVGIEGWGWVVAREPTTASSTPGAKDQGSSTGGTNTVTRAGTGRYIVRIGGLQTPAAVVHVSALGSAPIICSAGDQGRDENDFRAEVACFDRFGAPKDARFVVNVLALSTLQDDVGYVVATQPLAGQYEPEPQYNSAERRNAVDRLGKGRWSIALPDLGGIEGRGSVVVTASDATSTTCRVTSWSAGIVATVECRSRSGNLSNRAFSLTYLMGRGLKFEGEGDVAYVLADRPTTGSYTPTTGYRFSSAGVVPHITRGGVGVYRITLEGIPLGGSAQVSASGSGTRRCVVGGIRRTGLPQRITVRCFLANGSAPADAKFTLTYAN